MNTVIRKISLNEILENKSWTLLRDMSDGLNKIRVYYNNDSYDIILVDGYGDFIYAPYTLLTNLDFNNLYIKKLEQLVKHYSGFINPNIK